MESLKSFHDHLKDLRSQCEKSIEASSAWNTLFAEEETRLQREDEVSILNAVRCAVMEQIQQLKRTEASASCGYKQANLILSPVGLILTAIASKGSRLSAIADYLLHGPTTKEPFGLVMVCVGLNGLPEDVRGVSISQLSRESHRSEPEMINKLQGDGYLLFSGEEFILLIDRLAGDIRKERLGLPMSRDKLAEIAGLNKPELITKLIKVE